MYYKIIIFVSLYQLLSTTVLLSDNMCADIYPKTAKNVVLIFLDIHQNYNYSTNFCYDMAKSSITDVIQIYKEIDDLNLNLNFSIGVRICDSCQNDKLVEILTTENIIYLTQTLDNTKLLCMNFLFSLQFL